MSGGGITRVAVDANTVISGLFFRGNERRLLMTGHRGEVQLVLSEDVVDQVYEVVRARFSGHRDLGAALQALTVLLGTADLIERDAYRHRVASWRGRVRDTRDAPVLAGAEEADVDWLVSGDKDILVLAGKVGLPICRTSEILSKLGLREPKGRS